MNTDEQNKASTKKQTIEEDYPPLLSGRINRLTFLYYSLFPVFLCMLVLLKKEVGHEDYGSFFIMLFAIILMVISLIFIAIPRLHDINLSGLWALLLILVFVTFPFLFLILYFIPGWKDANKYGDPPLSHSKYIKPGAAILIFATILLYVTDDSFSKMMTAITYKARKAAEIKTAPLAIAIQKKDWSNVEYLLGKNENNDSAELKDHRTPLHLLLLQDDKEIAMKYSLLLISRDVNCDTQDKYGVTPLMLATGNDLKMLNAVLFCGAGDINTQNTNGNTALHYAVMEKDIEIARQLLKNGINPDIKNDAGNTALDRARNNHFLPMIKLLSQQSLKTD